MNKPKLYHNNGPTSRSVLLTANAIGLQFEHILINTLPGEEPDPDLVKLNPQHTLPTLVDKGKVIWDKYAIVKYLVAVYGQNTTFLPTDAYEMAKLDQRLHFDANVLYNSFGKVVRPVVYGNSCEFKESDIKSLLEVIDLLEIFLKNDLYFVGNNITVADFCIDSLLNPIFKSTIYKFFFYSIILIPIFKVVTIDNKTTRYPNILAWLERMSALPLPYYDKEWFNASLEATRNLFKNKMNENRTKTKHQY